MFFATSLPPSPRPPRLAPTTNTFAAAAAAKTVGTSCSPQSARRAAATCGSAWTASATVATWWSCAPPPTWRIPSTSPPSLSSKKTHRPPATRRHHHQLVCIHRRIININSSRSCVQPPHEIRWHRCSPLLLRAWFRRRGFRVMLLRRHGGRECRAAPMGRRGHRLRLRGTVGTARDVTVPLRRWEGGRGRGRGRWSRCRPR